MLVGMSYDLFVFDIEEAPRDRTLLDRWFLSETESEDVGDDPRTATERLQHWFADITQTFPALNGPGAPAEVVELASYGDYSILRGSIYVTFGWSEAQKAGKLVTETVLAHGCGLYDPQHTKESGWYFPTAGKLQLWKPPGEGPGWLAKVRGALGSRKDSGGLG